MSQRRSFRKIEDDDSQHDFVGVDLTLLPGVVVQRLSTPDDRARELTTDYDASNIYLIKMLPSGANIPKTKKDSNAWNPTNEDINNLTTVMTVTEERGGANMRVYEGNEETVNIKTPFSLGGMFCSPRMMEATYADENLGKVKQDFDPYIFKCLEAAIVGHNYVRVHVNVPNAPHIRKMARGGEDEQFIVQANKYCFGHSNNCFGGTSLNPRAVYDMINLNTGKVEGNIVNMYIKPNHNAVVLSFPEGASQEERFMLIVSSFMIAW